MVAVLSSKLAFREICALFYLHVKDAKQNKLSIIECECFKCLPQFTLLDGLDDDGLDDDCLDDDGFEESNF